MNVRQAKKIQPPSIAPQAFQLDEDSLHSVVAGIDIIGTLVRGDAPLLRRPNGDG